MVTQPMAGKSMERQAQTYRMAAAVTLLLAIAVAWLLIVIFPSPDFAGSLEEKADDTAIIRIIEHSSGTEPSGNRPLLIPGQSEPAAREEEPKDGRHGFGHSGNRKASAPADEPEEIDGEEPAPPGEPEETDEEPDEPADLIITPENFKVAFLGDGGLNDNYQAVLQLIEDEGAQLVIHSGDIVNDENPDYPQQWFDLISSVLDESRPFPYFYSLGNHDDEDWLGDAGHIGYRQLLQNRFDTLGLSYNGDPDELGGKTSFTYGGLFITLTAPGFEHEEPGRNFAGEDHASFLRQELGNNNYLWQICSWHKLMEKMQVGGKGDETGWGVYEACRENGALIANGHEHSYARTDVLSSMAWQMVADDTSPYLIQPGQTMTWHAGTSGQGLRDQERCFDDSCEEWASIYTADQGAVHGALFIEFHVDGDPRKARGYFKNINREFIDQFELYNRRGMEDEDEELPESPGESFVYAHNGELYLDGEEYTFVGVNAYGAANNENYSCGSQANHGDEPDAYLDSLFSTLSENGLNTVRFWAFQAFTDNGTDFRTFDRVFHYANLYGMKVIPVLENQWDHCPGNIYKESDWYGTGYQEPYGGSVLSFPEYVTAVAARYRNEPAIAMWQLMNEAESKPCGQRESCDPTLESTANLLSFAAEMSALIKSVDGNHLVSLGTMSTGQPGTAGRSLFDLHHLETIDVVEAHDYHHPEEALPAGRHSIAAALSLADALGKPFFIGEAGITADSEEEKQERAGLFDAKISALFGRGGDGYLIWEWSNPEYDRECGGYCFSEGDPLLDVLESYSGVK